jgi:hypothetical protein
LTITAVASEQFRLQYIYGNNVEMQHFPVTEIQNTYSDRQQES